MGGEKSVRGEPCPVCGRERWYCNNFAAKKFASKSCKACSNSICRGGPGNAYDSEGRKLCNDCRLRPIKHNSLCSECAVVRRQSYYQNKMRFERYGVGREWFESRFTGKCEICEAAVDAKSVNIDHNHDTGEVRGLLCKSCNLGLGLFKDNVGALKKAIEYLGDSK